MAKRKPKVSVRIQPIRELGPPIKANTTIENVAYGSICRLQCGCEVQAMTRHPHMFHLVNCRLLSWCAWGDPTKLHRKPCECLRYDCTVCNVGRYCPIRNSYAPHLIAGVCWTVNLYMTTEVHFDTLASELAIAFG